MASCKSVIVVCPNARRQTVKVGPTTTILQIRDEVCKKQGFSCQEFAIKHQRKILDETLPVRYSGLTNNAHLELVPQTKSTKTDAQSTVGLQLASGERLVKEFPPTHTLWDVISHWNTQEDSSHYSKLFGEEGQATVCVYMTQKITGETALKKTTLHQLGLAGKRAVIRLLHEASVKEFLPEDVDMISANSSTEKAPETATVPTQVGVAQDSQTEGSVAPMSSVSGMVSNPVQATVPTQVVVAQDSQTEGSVAPMSSVSGMVSNPVQALAATNGRQRQLEPGSVSPERGPRDPKCSKTTAGPAQLFPDFKFPEKPSNQDLSKAQATENFIVSEERMHLLSTPCDRAPLMFNENDMTLSSASEQGDLPDSFYELTVDDLRKMLQDLHSGRSKNENSPLMTKSMREARKLSESYKYDKIVIRVKFPDRFTLQGFFRPHEKVSVLTEFVRSHLEDPDTAFYLYTTPPKTVLKTDSTLFEAGLCPASLVYFGSNDKKDSYLATSCTQSLVSMLEAEQAALQGRGKSIREEQAHADQRAGTSHSNDQGPSSVTSQSRVDGGAASQSLTNRPAPGSSSGASKGGVPKWFKGTGKEISKGNNYCSSVSSSRPKTSDDRHAEVGQSSRGASSS